ncbi:carboxylesterase family protein [Nocardia sp. AG03]|uniref:carboxylesterase family protein n=1 Tax=Nocardia sp. AG03 TaxID=3025312 RepID=UPI0024184210|nr:carboxylesterase family protein [Nocardia sp. AG03]
MCVRTSTGVVRGRVENSLAVFRGIPYARPPFGALRFRASVAVAPWEGVRDAGSFGPAVPQAGHRGAVMSAVAGVVDDGSDECLSLNIWSPDLGGGGLPVMVWVHGGAYLEGTTANPHCDAATLAACGVLVVSVNYRTGFEGFAHIEGAPDNRGLLDQIAALRWVQENIAAFGGDPGTVTVFGQSAGAGCLAALVTMPSAAGLFRRAIVQSLPGTYFSPELAGAVSTAIAAEAGATASVTSLASTPPQALVDATATIIAKMAGYADIWGPMTTTPTPFSPVVDGEVLPQAPWRALATGAGREIDLLVGHTRDEYRLFAGDHGRAVTDADVRAALDVLAPSLDHDVYRAAHPDASSAQLVELVHADWLFRMPSLKLAEAHTGGRTWTYELRWAFNSDEDASHSLDVLLVFGTLTADDIRHHPAAYPDAAEQAVRLGRRMREDWVNFATSGDPGWPPYDPARRSTRVYTAEPVTLTYPEEISRRIWSDIEFDTLPLVPAGDTDPPVSPEPTSLTGVTITELPFGSWPTSITSESVVAAAVRLGEVRVDGTDVYWSEGRPSEGGRTQIVRRAADGTLTDLLPSGMDARTAVHEYGGAAWWVRDGALFFVNWADQRLYRLERDGAPVALTPEPAASRGDRYGDGAFAPDGSTIVAIRERHPVDGRGAVDVRNEIVRLSADRPSEPEVLVSGPDFVVAPRLDPTGTSLAVVSWDHPSMPWDDTVLRVRDLSTGAETVVAGGPGESVQEPRWQDDGSLLFLSDRSGWWNLYRWTPGGEVEAVIETRAEIGVPAWQLGSARYAVLGPDHGIVFARWRDGYDKLAVRHRDGSVTELDLPFSAIFAVVRAAENAVVVTAGTPTTELGVYRLTFDGPSLELETLRAPRDLGLAADDVSVPEPISFPSTDLAGSPRTAHALFYPPTSARHRGVDGERPPLLVMIHGGPTSQALPVLAPSTQYWTSRGFAVVDVNYGGSTGYGRAYRELLHEAWGIVDVADCLAAARWLADTGRVDPHRLAIRGGSAGGYTTLAALAHPDTPFSAGADHYGVADLEALAADTHKFESRYLDGLIGAYPAQRDRYRERSPIHHVDRFRSPLIVLQGSEDAVVPPNQSEMIVDALRQRRIPVAYLLFDGEQHGFRRAENIRTALDSELSFYAQVFDFPLPTDEGITPVEVENFASIQVGEPG